FGTHPECLRRAVPPFLGQPERWPEGGPNAQTGSGARNRSAPPRLERHARRRLWFWLGQGLWLWLWFWLWLLAAVSLVLLQPQALLRLPALLRRLLAAALFHGQLLLSPVPPLLARRVPALQGLGLGPALSGLGLGPRLSGLGMGSRLSGGLGMGP